MIAAWEIAVDPTAAFPVDTAECFHSLLAQAYPSKYTYIKDHQDAAGALMHLTDLIWGDAFSLYRFTESVVEAAFAERETTTHLSLDDIFANMFVSASGIPARSFEEAVITRVTTGGKTVSRTLESLPEVLTLVASPDCKHVATLPEEFTLPAAAGFYAETTYRMVGHMDRLGRTDSATGHWNGYFLRTDASGTRSYYFDPTGRGTVAPMDFNVTHTTRVILYEKV